MELTGGRGPTRLINHDFEGMPLEEDTQPLADQVMFGVAVVSRGPAYVLFNEMSPKEMATTHLYQAAFMPPMMSDGDDP